MILWSALTLRFGSSKTYMDDSASRGDGCAQKAVSVRAREAIVSHLTREIQGLPQNIVHALQCKI